MGVQGSMTRRDERAKPQGDATARLLPHGEGDAEGASMRGQDLEPSRWPWACDVARPPWKTLTVSYKVKCTFAAKPSNSTFVISLREMETHVHTQAYKRMSSAGLFMISQNWKQAQDPSTETETRGASPHMMESEGMRTAPKTLGFPVCNLPIMQLLAAVKSAVATNISGTVQSC